MRPLPAVLTTGLAAAVAALGCVAPAHGARDALTEEAVTKSWSGAATGYDARQGRGCQIRRNAPAVTVTCDRNGFAYLQYRFDVPRTAINLRAGSVPVATTGAQATAGTETGRVDADTFEVAVSLYGRGTYRFSDVEARYAVPQAYDHRSCVTGNEWRRINPSAGGVAGKIARVAAVFDSRGHQVRLSPSYDGFRYQVRSYRSCGSDRNRKVTFHHYEGTPGWFSYWG